MHPNLFVASELPKDLNAYQYIFLDSVNKLGLSAEDLTALKKRYPHKSFVFIFQTTKNGNFRGANSFQSRKNLRDGCGGGSCGERKGCWVWEV
jgi:hypothetical protein